ncbi:MAG: hypothetical protein E6J42_09180 [Chloroflexi bacterium]|nr:MAG: hypothetical protein E6J42_09180 [Chloroflexota bacterium]
MQEPQNFQAHRHDQMLHGHEHMHITHHARRGGASEIEHLTSTHAHEHNHPALEHAHFPHENMEREHQHEAHIHDHQHPSQS